MKNLIDILDLSTAEIDEMIAVANNIIEHPELYREACKYKTLATLFFEPSTRTRLYHRRIGGFINQLRLALLEKLQCLNRSKRQHTRA